MCIPSARRSGKVRPPTVMALERHPEVLDVPTTAEVPWSVSCCKTQTLRAPLNVVGGSSRQGARRAQCL
jgi:hypothetical protein